MDEQNTEIQETTTTTETSQIDAFNDDWSDVDLSDILQEPEGEDKNEENLDENEPESEEEPEADQQKEEPEEDSEGVQETEGQEEADQQLFELKHLGEVKTVNRDEVITLAQKGMNYDHIRQERDVARAEVERLGELESFLQELAGPGRTVDDLIDSTRASILANKEGIDEKVALDRVKLARERAAFEAEKKKGEAVVQAQNEEQQRNQKAFLRFHEVHPDVDPKTIPQKVWNAFIGGQADLADAYTQYENQQLKEQLKAMQEKEDARVQNEKNKKRSVGSQQSEGTSNKKKDLIDFYWDSDD